MINSTLIAAEAPIDYECTDDLCKLPDINICSGYSLAYVSAVTDDNGKTYIWGLLTTPDSEEDELEVVFDVAAMSLCFICCAWIVLESVVKSFNTLLASAAMAEGLEARYPTYDELVEAGKLPPIEYFLKKEEN